MLAIGHDDEAGFLTLQKLLDHDLGARIAEAACEHLEHDRFGLLEALRDDHALARSESAGLDHDRRALCTQPRAIKIAPREAAVSRSRNAVALQKVFGESLRALKPGGLSARAKAAQPRRAERIDDAGDQRGLRTDDRQADGLALCELEQRRDVVRRDV